MKKPIFIMLLLFSIIFFDSCNTNKTASGKTVANKKTEVEEAWRIASSVDDLQGKWISANGSFYQYPFLIEDKSYLRWATKVEDATDLWQEYADKKNLPLEKLWNKRFACIDEIYGRRLPFACNGYEEGLKLFLENDRIMQRFERLFPVDLVDGNLSFFQISNTGKIRGYGSFFVDSDNSLSSDGIEYFYTVD